MPPDNGFYKKQYFDQLNERLDTLEVKIDDLSKQMSWAKGWAAGLGAIAALIVEVLFRKL